MTGILLNAYEIAGDGYGDEQVTIANGVSVVDVCYNLLTNCYNGVGGGEGIDLKAGVSTASVYGNEIEYCAKYGIYLDGGDSRPDFYSSPSFVSNVWVFANKTHNLGNCGIGVTSEGFGDLDAIYVYNNLSWSNINDGILLYDDGKTSRSNYANNITIINNTTYGNTRNGVRVDHHYATGVTLRNNIGFANTVSNLYNKNNPTAVIDHNFTNEDPSFVSLSAPDFHLMSNSLAIDYGTNWGAFPTDFDGASRPSGLNYDAGAYEFSLSPTYEAEDVESWFSGATNAEIVYDSNVSVLLTPARQGAGRGGRVGHGKFM